MAVSIPTLEDSQRLLPGGHPVIVFSAWAPTFAVLLIARMGLGAIYLSTQPPRTLLILQWIPRRHIGLANSILFSILEAMLGLGYIVLPLLLVWLGGWRDTLYTCAGVCLVASVLWMILGRDRITPEYSEGMKSQVKTPLGSLFKYREPWILGLGVAGAMVGHIAFVTFWPTFTGDEYGTPIALAGLVLGLNALAAAPAILGVTTLPFFARRSPMVLIVCGLGLNLTYIGLLFTGSVPILVVLWILSGISLSFLPLMVTTIYSLPGIKPREVAVAVALVYTLLWVGSAIGPLIAGFVQEATDDLRLALIITSFGPLVLTAVGLVLSSAGRKIVEPAVAPIAGSR